MAVAGADVVIAHLGLAMGDGVGGPSCHTLDEAVTAVQAMADAAHEINPGWRAPGVRNPLMPCISSCP